VARGIPGPELPVGRAGRAEPERRRYTPLLGEGGCSTRPLRRIGEGFGAWGAGRSGVPREEEREGGVEAGVVDSGAVAAEHGDGVRRRAAAGPLDAGHLAPAQAGLEPNGTPADEFVRERFYSLPLTRARGPLVGLK